MTPIITQRLSLRVPTFADKANLFLLDSNPNVMRYIGSRNVRNREESALYLQEAMKISDGNLGYWIAESRESTDFVGLFLLKKLEDTTEIEIGYRLMEQQWGKGYATEGAKMLLHHAFINLNLERIVAVTFPENVNSKKVLHKIGLSYERDSHHYGGEVVYYSLNKVDYHLLLLN